LKVRLVQYLLALITVASMIAILYTLPVETAATSIIALLILVHLAIISVIWGGQSWGDERSNCLPLFQLLLYTTLL
jgi:hypothetical protein